MACSMHTMFLELPLPGAYSFPWKIIQVSDISSVPGSTLQLTFRFIFSFTQSPKGAPCKDSDLASSYLDSAAFWSLGANIHGPITLSFYMPAHQISAIWSMPNAPFSQKYNLALLEYNFSCLRVPSLLNCESTSLSNSFQEENPVGSSKHLLSV